MKKIVFILIFVVLLLIIGINTVSACQCMLIANQKKRVKLWKKESVGIFVGTVQSVSAESENIDGNYYKRIVLKVAKSWKSVKQAEITIYFSQGCFEFILEKGKFYLIYAKKAETNQLITQICFGTHETSTDDKDVKYLGKPDFINKN